MQSQHKQADMGCFSPASVGCHKKRLNLRDGVRIIVQTKRDAGHVVIDEVGEEGFTQILVACRVLICEM